MTKKILWVETYGTLPQVRDVLQRVTGYDFKPTYSRKEAEDALNNNEYGGAIMVGLGLAPGAKEYENGPVFYQHGLALISHIKQKNLPLVVLVEASDDELKKTLELGADRAFLEPQRVEELRQACREVFGY